MNNNMVAECQKRLEILEEMGLWDEVTKVYKKKSVACVSEARMILELCGVNFTFNEKPELNAIKERFEAEYGYAVYYGIYSNTNLGRHLALLFVPTDKEEWKADQEDLKEGYPYAYVWNLDKEFGEFGSIGIKMSAGGLVRTA